MCIILNLTYTVMHSLREQPVSVEKLKEIILHEHDYCSNQSSLTNIPENTSIVCENSQRESKC